MAMFNGKTHYFVAMFNSHVSHYQKVNPKQSHESTIFLWFSYGFPMKTI